MTPLSRGESSRSMSHMRAASPLRRTLYVVALALALPGRAVAQRACDELPATTSPAGGWTIPLDARVTLRARDVSLRDALDRLTALTGVQLAYSADVLPVDRRVCDGALAVGALVLHR